MPAQRTRNGVHYVAYPSNATDNRSLQCRLCNHQRSFSSPVYNSEETMNQRQNVSSRPTAYPVMPWRYPPLFPRFDVPAIEYPNQNHQVVSQAASIVPVTYSAPDSRHPPNVRGPSFSGARHDMWFVDRSSDVRTTFSSSQWTLDRRQSWQPLINPLRAPEGSRRGEGSIINDPERNVNEAFNPPWFHAPVPETDPCIICHPSSGIWNRTVPAPSPRDVPQPMDPLSNGHLLSFLDLLDKVNYLDVDQCSHETLALEPGKFFTNSRKVKQELAGMLLSISISFFNSSVI